MVHRGIYRNLLVKTVNFTGKCSNIAERWLVYLGTLFNIVSFAFAGSHMS